MGWFKDKLAAPLLSGGLSLIGDKLNRDSQDKANRQNAELQREFARMGIRWKVEDATAAGIHPLIALGASGYSASPSYVGSQSNTLSNFGQDISRSIGSTMTAQERLEARLRAENMGLQNDLLRKQINSISSPGNPPMPSGGTDNFIGGQGDSGVMLVRPSERISHAPGRLAQEMGARPDVSYSRTDTGLVPMIPQGLSESLEDDMVGKILWRIRNQLYPNVTGTGSPPKSQLPSWANSWRWDRLSQEWRPAVLGGPRSLKGRIYDSFRYKRGR